MCPPLPLPRTDVSKRTPFFSASGPAATKPTIYWQRKQRQAFHIDHAFVPFAWCDRHGFRMAIGTFEDWVATGLSDHVPLVVDIPGPQAPQRERWTDLLEGRSAPGVRGGTLTERVSPQE